MKTSIAKFLKIKDNSIKGFVRSTFSCPLTNINETGNMYLKCYLCEINNRVLTDSHLF
jgi:hypothetical protein